MNLFGWQITRAPRPARAKAVQTLSGVDSPSAWTNLWPGAGWQDWQRDIEPNPDAVLANWAVYACVTLIAADVGKLRLELVEQTADGIWQPASSAAFTPVLRRPNRHQTRQKFIEQWLISKLTNGNAYILKQRDARGIVNDMHVLNPDRVRTLVALTGEVFYELQEDDLSGVHEPLPAVPASEIIHDTMVALFHPLVGVSPVFACGLAATQGLKIQQNSAKFFQNMSRPSGMLTAPTQISPETAARLKEHWEANFTGDKIGKVAVLGDGLKYEAMSINAVDSQMVEQLKMSAEMVCSAFHVPAFKIGAGTIPAGQKVEDLNQIYYTDCLQSLIESIEALLDDGLGLTMPKDGRQYGTEFCLDDLLKMDTASMVDALNKGVGGGWLMPNEARRRRNLPPVTGGETPYLQQQNYSLAALARRDAQADPFAAATPAPPPPGEDDNDDDDTLAPDAAAKLLADRILASLAHHA